MPGPSCCKPGFLPSLLRTKSIEQTIADASGPDRELKRSLTDGT